MPEHEGGGPVCRELQVIGAAEWRTQQEQDSDLQPVLQWVETESLTVSPVRDSHRTPRTLSVPEQQQQQVDLTGATRPRRRRRPPGRFEDFV
ncbi:hypothetical protein AAFF_G00051290 [Aldrovandia affinis]|uniref:Uncharacterized protein n=1 Tax=Aldrovandia affinis TaxID=143900 RepID=A0AAD7T4E1_9TELE|nr:hypothetical protein AAFF_G00051290 [Aldrovandia affinis]